MSKEEKIEVQEAPEQLGEVCIADDVVTVIAALAATEVEGVDCLAGNITNSVIGKIGVKNLQKGVKVDVTEEHVTVALSVIIKYSYNIPEVSAKVQDRVMSAIENMTGLKVIEVNVKIAGVNIE